MGSREANLKGWQEGTDDEDEYWSDLVISNDTYLTDEHRFVADTGSFQFCKDLNGELVDLGEAHTTHSTLNDLLRNREIFLARSTKDIGDSTSE